MKKCNATWYYYKLVPLLGYVVTKCQKYPKQF